MMDKVPKIAVLGSINMDIVIKCMSLPTPGETITARSALEIPGGKGANQAVSASRAGGQVAMIGRLGDDGFSEKLWSTLKHDRISTEHVIRTRNSASGIAIVAVEDSGENAIMVVPGANGQVTPKDVDHAATTIGAADILLLQLEIPIDAVERAICIAADADVPVILDPAPMLDTLSDTLIGADVICPNQAEAAVLAGHPVDTIEAAIAAVPLLHQRGARQVIITLGRMGTIVSDGESIESIPPFQVAAKDTTAAGDAFAGALAVRLGQSASLVDAAVFASAAGAIAATRVGAQPAMPQRDEIESLVQQ